MAIEIGCPLPTLWPYIKHMTTYVIGFMFTNDWKDVLLIRKNRPAWQAGKLNGVGGHIEPGEEPIQAMVREFKEETGLTTTNKDWTQMLIVTNQDYQIYVFRTYIDNVGIIEGKNKVVIDQKLFGAGGPHEQLEMRSVQGIRPIKLKEVVDGLLWMLYLCVDQAVDPPVIIHMSTLKGDGK